MVFDLAQLEFLDTPCSVRQYGGAYNTLLFLILLHEGIPLQRNTLNKFRFYHVFLPALAQNSEVHSHKRLQF